MLREINFDGLIGPSHNYAGLSPGNLAATRNSGNVSAPRAAALQGIEKMRANLRLGLAQGIFYPLARPDHAWLASLGTRYADAPRHLQAQALSASAMWAANAATVSPAPDTADGKCHLSVANLVTMKHRSHEWPGTLAQLRVAFADPAFVVHAPVPPPFGDEGPARQSRDASEAIARRHGLSPERCLFVEQSTIAIAAGAFHNDVVAVANGPVLFTHEFAFADRLGTHAELRARMPEVEIVEVPAARVSLADAISSYLFNAQLVTLPGDGGMALILPTEARDTPAVWDWLQEHVAGNGPIRRLEVVDVRQSMANGGGPACLRLRVVADPERVDPRFIVDEARLDRIAEIVAARWPEEIAPDQIADPELILQIESARHALLSAMELSELLTD
ncbi:N-succinylarginine dihydrolase [Sphingomonas sp. CCH16-B10]|uniref:N-succinylarginine dihydrolase n=1 Tax=Sphingomonas sp. CCH16-B10 TaxID=1768755 RepID=UPI000830872B|nr:N-succinylarginine dihydrolase [Sphingomonas sp. CCH16-B10]